MIGYFIGLIIAVAISYHVGQDNKVCTKTFEHNDKTYECKVK